MPRQTPSNRSLAALTVLVLTGSLLMLLGALASPPASALQPPIVPIPSCYKTFTNTEFCPQVNPGDSTYHDPDYGTGLGATISGSMTSGTSYSVTLDPPVGPCLNQSQSSCYVSVTHVPYNGVSYFMTYASHTSTHRVGERVTGSISSQPGVMRVEPQNSCDEDFNNVYGDGGDFAERAAAALTCTVDFKYAKSYDDDTLVPIDRLRGPTWVASAGSIWVCDQPGGRNCSGHQEYVVSLVRLNGELAPGVTASCEVGAQSGPGGSSIRFDGDADPSTLLDLVRSWTVQPASAMRTVTHASYNKYESRVAVTATEAGQVSATYRVESWHGSSNATCEATVLDDPDLPTPTEEPTSPPTAPPTSPPTTPPTTPPTAPPDCRGDGKPKLSVASARVGKAVKVKPGPWGDDARLSYIWKAGSVKVGTKAKLVPKQGMVGKKLKVTITAQRRGCEQPEKRSLSAGKVRSVG